MDGGPFGEDIGLVITVTVRGATLTARSSSPPVPGASRSLSTMRSGTVIERAHTVGLPRNAFQHGGDDRTTGLGVTQYDREAYTTTPSVRPTDWTCRRRQSMQRRSVSGRKAPVSGNRCARCCARLSPP